MNKRLLFLQFLIVLSATAEFTLEKLNVPYSLYIYFADEIADQRGNFSLSITGNTPLMEERTDFDLHVTIDDCFSQPNLTAPTDSTILKNESGYSVLLTSSSNVTHIDNHAHHNYEAMAENDTPLIELFELLLQTFGKQSRFDFLKFGNSNDFSVTDAMLEVIINQGFHFDTLLLGFGRKSPSVEIVQKLVEVAKPSVLSLSIGDDNRTVDEPRLILPDSFFRCEAVRNLSEIFLRGMDVEILDDSLGDLNAWTIRLPEAKNITFKGIENWMKPILHEKPGSKWLCMKQSPIQKESLVDELKAKFYFIQIDFDEVATILGFRTGFIAELIIRRHNHPLEGKILEVIADGSETSRGGQRGGYSCF